MSDATAGSVEVQLGANIQGLIDNLGKAAGATNNAFGDMTHAAEGLKGNLGALSESIEHLGAGVLVFGALGLAAEGIEKACEYLKDAVKETMELAESFHKLSYETGISYENLATYSAAMTMIGGNVNQLEGWVRGQTRALKSNADSLVANGIAANKAELMGLSFEDYLKRVDEKAQTLSNTNERNALMMMAFSRSGVSAGAEMHRLAEGLEDGRKAAQEMGLELNGNDVEAMEELQKASGRIDVGLQALKVRVGTELMPVLVEFARLVGDYLPGMIDYMVLATKGFLFVLNDLKFGSAVTMTYIDGAFEHTKTSAITVFSAINAAAHLDLKGAWEIMKAGATEAEVAWASVEMKIASAVMEHDAAEAKIAAPRSKGKESAAPGGNGHVKTKGDDASPMAGWEAELQKQKALLAQSDGDLAEMSKEDEKSFWEAKLTKTKQGSTDWVAVRLKMVELGKTLDKEEEAEVKRIVDEHGAEELAASKQTQELAKMKAHAEIDAAKEALAAQKDALEQRVARGEITHAQELAALRQFVAQEKAIELQAVTAEQIGMDKESVAFQKLENDKTKIKTKAVNEQTKLTDKALTQEQKTWSNWIKGLTSGFSSAISGLIQGTETWGQAFKSVLSSALSYAIDFFVQWGLEELTTIATTSAAHTTASTKKIGENAAEAGSAGMKSAAEIPIYGWAIAIGAGLAIFAAASGMKSAANGWDRVPSNQMAMIHEDEMVMSAPLANGIRQIIANGQTGGGSSSTGDLHLHIQAMDAKSFVDMARRNVSGLGAVLREAMKNKRI